MNQTTETSTWTRDPLPPVMRIMRWLQPLLFRMLWPIAVHIRKKNADTRVAGMPLRTRLQVFHPRLFFSSKIFAEYVAALPLQGKRFLDMGTGSGIIGLVAAKHGARVLAVDINPEAVQLAAENAALHNASDAMQCRRSDLFAAVEADTRFDYIAFNPPFFAGKAETPEKAAWFAGEAHETITQFLTDAKKHLRKSGRILMILSSLMPLAALDRRFAEIGYAVTAHTRIRHLVEFFHIIELRPAADSETAAAGD